jgi:iron(III) transport system ATP-binding protein
MAVVAPASLIAAKQPAPALVAAGSPAAGSIALERVWHRYGREPSDGWCLQDLSLSLEPGELLGLLGPSGCGKTTLLRLIAGFERPSRGRVVLDGREVAGPHHWLAPERRGVGMVFQDYALFPHLTAWQNACFGLPRGSSPTNVQGPGPERVRWLLSLLGLAGLEQRYPHALSGGQRQRLALARALAPGPRLLLLDEPFSNLDGEVRLRLRRELPGVLRQCQTSAVLVTHDPEEALAVCDRIAVLSAGRLEQCAPAQDLVARPASPFVARFVMQANVLPARLQAGELQTAWGRWRPSAPAAIAPQEPPSGGPLEVVVLGEALGLEADVQGTARVLGREFHGHHWQLHLEDHGCLFTLKTPLDCPVEPGQFCRLHLIRGGRGLLFPGGQPVEVV